MDKANSAKKKTELPIVRYLVYLIILTSVVFAASLSKYATTSSTSDHVRVAKFDVDITPCFTWVETPQGYYLDAIFLGDSKDYCFDVENKGEVVVKVRVINADTGDPLISDYVLYDADDNVVALDANGWFYLSVADTYDAFRKIRATVNANDLATIIRFRFEIEQVD